MSAQEKAGIQALERPYPTKLARPGLVERREFEYVRHSMLTLIANFEVTLREVITPSPGPTRIEADFAAHIEFTIASVLDTEGVFVADQLKIHQSDSTCAW